MRIKRSKKDFTRNDLPKNRWEVFGDCLKMRFMLFVYMGLTLLVCSIPLFFVTFLKDNTVSALYAAYSNAEYTKEEYFALMQSANSIYSLFFIPCYLVLAIGVSGVMQVIRQLVWGEGVFFMQDTLEGVKSNGILYASIALIMGGIVYSINTFLPLQNSTSSVVASILVILFIVPPTGLVVSQAVVYKNNFIKYYVNGFSLYVRTVPKTLLFTVLFVLPCVLGLDLVPFLIKYIVMFVFFLFLAPMLFTGWFLYSCSVFDKYINKETYPEIYDKGVFGKADTDKVSEMQKSE